MKLIDKSCESNIKTVVKNISLKRRYDTPPHEELKHSVSTNSATANKKPQNTERC